MPYRHQVFERDDNGDAAQDSVTAKPLQRLRDAWSQFEAAIAPRSYLLGDRLSALDGYVAMASVLVTERHPVVASAWARNFD